MIERELDIATQDGAMNTWTVRPDDGGPLPVVLMLMDAPGVRGGLEGNLPAHRASGYYVILPNLYYRTLRDFECGPTRDTPMPKPTASACSAIWNDLECQGRSRRRRDPRPAAVDARCAARQDRPGRLLHERRLCDRRCGAHPDRIACFASYYGTRLITDKPDSPHLMLGAITGEGYFSFAEHDDYVPLSDVSNSKSCWRRRRSLRVETEKGTHHGYAFSDRGNLHEAAREKHYERMLALYRRHLG